MAYNPRYCLEPLDVRRLKRMWNDNVRYDNDGWQCFDDFTLWSSDMGYAKGMYLKKRNELMHHSPENSYFGDSIQEVAQNRERKKRETRAIKSPFCEGCQNECSNIARGCEEYQKWFAKNWNENIRIAKPEVKEKSNSVQFFRYEHPDLVREGIVFNGSGTDGN